MAGSEAQQPPSQNHRKRPRAAIPRLGLATYADLLDTLRLNGANLPAQRAARRRRSRRPGIAAVSRTPARRTPKRMLQPDDSVRDILTAWQAGRIGARQ